jgi:dipeptidase E
MVLHVNKLMIFINILSIILVLFWLYDNYFYIIEYYFSRYFFYSNITLQPSETRNLLLFSNSTMTTIGPDDHFNYALPILDKFLKPHNVKEILVLTYATPDVRDGVDTKTFSNLLLETMTNSFKKIGVKINVLDTEASDIIQQSEIKNAEAIYITGGNTFLLTKALYEKGVLNILKGKIDAGTPVVGVSAGTNIHCPTMQTTNDMPIVCPINCSTLNSIPFQINVKYNNLSSNKGLFTGETRDARLKEYLENNRTFDSTTIPTFVVGLKEGTAIHVSGDEAELVGFRTRPAELLMLDEKGELIKKQLQIGSRVDNLLRLQV